jgi:hypothetical protein
MTSREVYEGVLIELDKKGSPDLLIDEFNYYINKGMYEYVNKRYNVYDINQQTSDDLQVLKESADIVGTAIKAIGETTSTSDGISITEARFNAILPLNYFHLTNCVLEYKLKKDFKCYKKDTLYSIGARRITSDLYAGVIQNAWLRPQYKNPYYMIQNNQNVVKGKWASDANYDNDLVDAKILDVAGKETAHNSFEDANSNGKLDTGDTFVGPTMLVDYGKDDSIFGLNKIKLNYLKVPSQVNLTPDQIDLTEDKSQVMEFPDYVCREIIKEIVQLVMLRNGDPSLTAHKVVNTSIPGMTQQPAGEEA